MIMISIIILIDFSVVMTYTAGYIMIAMSAHEAHMKLTTNSHEAHMKLRMLQKIKFLSQKKINSVIFYLLKK